MRCPMCGSPVSTPSVYVFKDVQECRRLKKELEAGGEGFGVTVLASDLLMSAKRINRWQDNARPVSRRYLRRRSRQLFVTKDRYLAIWLFHHKQTTRPVGVVWKRGCRCTGESTSRVMG
jgi:hypothetical protein